MYDINPSVLAAFQNGDRQTAKITGLVSEVVTESRIVEGGLVINRYSNTTNGIKPGSVTSAEATIILDNADGHFDSQDMFGNKFTIKVGVSTIANSYVPMGTFTVDSYKRQKSKIVIKALDDMVLLDAPIKPNLLTFPTTPDGLINQICTIFHINRAVSVKPYTFPNMNYTIVGLPSSAETYRDLLAWCCEIICCNAQFNYDNSLYTDWYYLAPLAVPYAITDSNRYDSDFSEKPVEFSGVVIETQNGRVTNSGATMDYPIVITGNPLITHDESSVATSIWNFVRQLDFYTRQFSATALPLPHLYPMDSIDLRTDGFPNYCFITDVTFKLNGSTKLRCNVNEEKQTGTYHDYNYNKAFMTKVSQDEFENEITTINTQFDVQQGQINSKVEYSVYNTNKIATDSNISTLQGDVTTLEGNVSTIGGNVTTLQGDVGELQGDVGTLGQDVNALEGDVGTLQGDVNALNGELNTVKATVVTHTTQIQQNQDAINLRATKTEAQTYANSAADALNQALQTTTVQLVKNGNLQINDDSGDWAYNWLYSGNVDDRLHLSNEGVNGSSRSFYATTNSHTASGQIRIYSDEKIPVDTTVEYEVSVDAKGVHYIEGEPLTDICYVGLDSYDADKLQITPYQCMFMSGSTTSLSQDLKNGDTVIHFTSLNGWRNASASYQRGCIFWNYKNSFGYTYPEQTYSRNSWTNIYTDDSKVDRVNNTITLSSPWNYGTIPAGTRVSQTNSGATYIYCTIGGASLTKEWKTYSGIVSGMRTDGLIDNFHFRQGTSYVRFNILAVYNSVNSEGQNFTNMSIKPSFQKQINSLNSEIDVQAGKIGLVVEEVSGGNRIKAASIVTAINAEGSSVELNADHINLNGYTDINGYFVVDNNGRVSIKDCMLDIETAYAEESKIELRHRTHYGTSDSVERTRLAAGEIYAEYLTGNPNASPSAMTLEHATYYTASGMYAFEGDPSNPTSCVNVEHDLINLKNVTIYVDNQIAVQQGRILTFGGVHREYKSSTINATAGQTISVTVPNGCTGTVNVSYMSGGNYVGGGIIAFDSFKTGSNVDGSVTALHNHASGITAPTWVAQRLDSGVLYVRATCSSAITYKIAVEIVSID